MIFSNFSYVFTIVFFVLQFAEVIIGYRYNESITAFRKGMKNHGLKIKDIRETDNGFTFRLVLNWKEWVFSSKNKFNIDLSRFKEDYTMEIDFLGHRALPIFKDVKIPFYIKTIEKSSVVALEADKSFRLLTIFNDIKFEYDFQIEYMLEKHKKSA